MKKDLSKYNKPVPRYTSYPPVPDWTGAPKLADWMASINKYQAEDGGVDLYIHIPFCQQLCWYCGCNRIIKKNKEHGTVYVDYLLREWALYKKNIEDLKINSIHFGGGTPNYLKADDFQHLLDNLKESFSENFFGSIEIDPRTIEDDFLDVMNNFSFKRVSMGIQDFDLDVQKAINRVQPFILVEKVVEKLRSQDVDSINFDLIYGLPKQSLRTIEETINSVIRISPDLLAFYSYAHLPKSLKNQKLINEEDLLEGEMKKELFEFGKKLLLEAGYIQVGFDHFAKSDSYLGKACLNKSLKRSFMGYTDEKSQCLLALGVSGISNTPEFFWQNQKDLKKYYKTIDSNFIAHNGHCLSENEKKVSIEIQNLMCNGSFSIKEIKDSSTTKVLTEMEKDGLLMICGENVELTEVGKELSRNIAEVLDPNRIVNGSKIFSSSV